MRFFMAYKWTISFTTLIIILIIYILSIRSFPVSFEYENKAIYLSVLNGKYIITSNPRPDRSKNHLVIVDDGDTFDKLLIYVNLCDSSYHVIVRGGIEVVGKPEFTYEEIGWYFDERQKRLKREYSGSDCKFTYYE